MSDSDDTSDKIDIILAELKKLQEYSKRKFEENKETNNKILKQVGDINKEISNLKKDNIQLKDIVNTQQTKIERLEKQLLDSTVNIQGVPFEEGEDLLDIVHNIFSKTNLKLTTSTINKIYRKKPKANGSPGQIIVKLNSNTVQRSLLNNTKKGKITAEDLGFKNNPAKIYVNQELTQSEKKIFFEARKLQKSKKWKYVWEKGGATLIKLTEDSQAIKVSSLQHLESLMKQ